MSDEVWKHRGRHMQFFNLLGSRQPAPIRFLIIFKFQLALKCGLVDVWFGQQSYFGNVVGSNPGFDPKNVYVYLNIFTPTIIRVKLYSLGLFTVVISKWHQLV